MIIIDLITTSMVYACSSSRSSIIIVVYALAMAEAGQQYMQLNMLEYPSRHTPSPRLISKPVAAYG
jgi:hypothetical protein